MGGTIPVEPSVDSQPQTTRSGDSPLIAAVSTWAVVSASAPARPSSLMWIARSAPMLRPLRMASAALAGPIETRTTSASSAASLIRSAASTPYSSPGSSTTSPSRARRLSEVSLRVALGSGICLTVTTIFKRAFSVNAVNLNLIMADGVIGPIGKPDSPPGYLCSRTASHRALPARLREAARALRPPSDGGRRAASR